MLIRMNDLAILISFIPTSIKEAESYTYPPVLAVRINRCEADWKGSLRVQSTKSAICLVEIVFLGRTIRMICIPRFKFFWQRRMVGTSFHSNIADLFSTSMGQCFLLFAPGWYIEPAFGDMIRQLGHTVSDIPLELVLRRCCVILLVVTDEIHILEYLDLFDAFRPLQPILPFFVGGAQHIVGIDPVEAGQVVYRISNCQASVGS